MLLTKVKSQTATILDCCYIKKWLYKR